jgi:hypothetical protein
MDAPRRPDPRRRDPERTGRDWSASPGWLAAALGVAAGALALWWTAPAAPTLDVAVAPVAPLPAAWVMAGHAAPGATPPLAVASIAAPPPRPVAAAPVAPVAPPRIARQRDPGGDQTPDIVDYINEGERPSMNEVIDRLHQAGIRSGLGAFSPPGTRPPLVGLAVPEDFPLPDGYVRHHQATDDGQRIEPVLMFAPDRQFVDAAGRPFAIPKDRLVPPELAPPGLPVRRITIPAPIDAGTPAR